MKLDWGKSIFLFFVVFISLAIVFIVFSFKHKPELVTKEYYEEGAAYTEQININKRSGLYSDSIKLKQINDNIVLRFSPTLPEKVDSLKIHFYYPSGEKKDYTLNTKLENDSIVVPKLKLTSGRCIVKISWQMMNENFYLAKDFFVK